MTDNNSAEKQINTISRLVGIFVSPSETFQDLDRKPTWLFPLVVVALLVVVMQLLVLDIGISDRIAMAEAKGTAAEQVESEYSSK